MPENNIDVTRCELYNSKFKSCDIGGGVDCFPDAPIDYCKNNPNCYYKQLDAKNRELKHYKFIVQLGIEIIEEREQQLQAKEAECETNKKRIQELEQSLYNKDLSLDVQMTLAETRRDDIEDLERIIWELETELKLLRKGE